MIPIDDFEGAADYFTFGGDSLGVWITFILGVVVFCGLIAYMINHENRAYAGCESIEGDTSMHAAAPIGEEPSTDPVAAS